MKIGYLGPQGTFSQAALNLYQKQKSLTNNIEQLPYTTMPLLLVAVERGEISEGIVPIENSLEGPINIILDQLAFDRHLFIREEIICPVTECLMAQKGVTHDEIKRIISHPQPIGQCASWLQSHLPTAGLFYSNSTADGATQVNQGHFDAVIGSALLAEIYGLEILQTHIEDNPNNSTRFIVVGQEPNSQQTSKDKTSIVFSVNNQPGNLYRVLDIFNLWDINMTKIESRPSKQRLGEYIFFVDLVGNIENPDLADALKMIQRKSSFFKFLGSYPSSL